MNLFHPKVENHLPKGFYWSLIQVWGDWGDGEEGKEHGGSLQSPALLQWRAQVVLSGGLFALGLWVCRTWGEVSGILLIHRDGKLAMLLIPNKQTLFSFNSSSESELLVGFDGSNLAKEPVCAKRRASAWSTAHSALCLGYATAEGRPLAQDALNQWL